MAACNGKGAEMRSKGRQGEGGGSVGIYGGVVVVV